MEKSSFYYSRTGQVLRWILFIPISILAGFLVSLLALGFTYLRVRFIGGDGQWDLMIPPYFFYIAFTYVAWFIIPKHKNKVIGFLIICKIIFSVYILFNYDNYDTTLSMGMFIMQEVFTALSCFILSIYLSAKYEEEEEIEVDEDEDEDESEDMFRGIDEIMTKYRKEED